MKFSIKDFFSKCDQIRSFLRIWSHLLKKSLMENVVFCAVDGITLSSYVEGYVKLKKNSSLNFISLVSFQLSKIWIFFGKFTVEIVWKSEIIR